MRALLMAALLLVAQSSPITPSPSPEPSPPREAPSAVPGQKPDCERQRYPCALSEVDPAVVQRSLSLMEEADMRLTTQASIEDTASWLRGQERVVEVQADRDALRFRLEGGRPMWVIASDAVAPIAGPSVQLAVARPPATRPGRRALDLPVNEGDPTKRALVLSPWKWDFGAEDDGALVAGTLAGTRGYPNGVTYIENATPESSQVNVNSFTGWDGYDVVHVVSHGTTVCDGQTCRAMIMIPPRLDPVPDPSELQAAGLELATMAGDTFVALGADFFKSRYPGGLDNTIVMVNACETLTGSGSDLGQSLAGATSVYFGWSDAVFSSHASAAAFGLYGELGKGRVTAKAHESLGAKGQSSWKTPSGKVVNAQLLRLGRGVGGDLRLRENITVLDPETGVELADGAKVEVIGQAQDGQPDAVITTIMVEGIEPGEEPSYQVQVAVGQTTGDPFALTAGAAADSGVVVFSGQLDLERDVKDGEEVDIVARVQLPDTGFSEDRAHVVLDASPEYVWVGTATAVSDFSGQIQEIHADVTFELADEPTPGVERYLARGELTWTVSGGSGSCVYNAGPVTVPIDAAPDSDDGSLQIDWNQEPAVYFGAGTVEGDEVDVASTCGPVSLPAGGPWLFMTSLQPVDADGTLIEGSSSNGLTEFTWRFERRTVGG